MCNEDVCARVGRTRSAPGYFRYQGFLKSLLIPGSPHHQYPRQHSNIRAAIELYENSKLDGSKVLIVGGEVVSNEDTLKAGLPVWSEVSAMPYLSLKYVLTGNLGRLLSSNSCKRPHIPTTCK